MSASAKSTQAKKRGFFGRIVLFFRQVVDEMRKVVWPTRKELSTYFVVVVFFILVLMAFTGVLDTAFDAIVRWVFA